MKVKIVEASEIAAELRRWVAGPGPAALQRLQRAATHPEVFERDLEPTLRTALDSRITLWATRDMMEVALERCRSVPRDYAVCPEDLFALHGYFIGEVALNFEIRTVGIAWTSDAFAVSLVPFKLMPHDADTSRGLAGLMRFGRLRILPAHGVISVPFGRPLPNTAHGLFMVSLLGMAKEKVFAPERLVPAREHRRRCARLGLELSVVSAINLREVLQSSDQPGEPRGPLLRRSRVREHYRRCGSEKRWKRIYSYDRGPEDAPFLIGDKVYKVVR